MQAGGKGGRRALCVCRQTPAQTHTHTSSRRPSHTKKTTTTKNQHQRNRVFVAWLDVVTYLHHHGSDTEGEKMPWYRGGQWSYLRGGLTTLKAALNKTAATAVVASGIASKAAWLNRTAETKLAAVNASLVEARRVKAAAVNGSALAATLEGGGGVAGVGAGCGGVAIGCVEPEVSSGSGGAEEGGDRAVAGGVRE